MPWRGDPNGIARSSLDELDRGLGLVANAHPESDRAADASRVVGAVAPRILREVSVLPVANVVRAGSDTPSWTLASWRDIERSLRTVP